MSTLVIVESPAKCKTIGKYLGKEYVVKASMGHVRDLPPKELGVDVADNYALQYVTIPTKKNTVDSLKREMAKHANVLLASDEDREGEAIAWHLSKILGVNPTSQCRVTFNAITQKGIQQGLQNVRSIYMEKVDSQQARRAVDRLVGFKVSPAAGRALKNFRLSAGRVQSALLRIMVDRQKAIEAFVKEESWEIKVKTQTGTGNELWLKFCPSSPIKTEALADNCLAYLQEQSFLVSDIEKRTMQKKPAPPFTTSTFQQAAATRLKLNQSKAMKIAQELYEGINIDGSPTGLITYMRTDSVRISPEAQQEARTFILGHFGLEKRYLPENAPEYKTKKDNVQDAHEAIRPADLSKTPDSLKGKLPDEAWQVYDMIYKRFIASQMAPAIYDVVSVTVTAGKANLKASGSTEKFDGFKVLWAEEKEESAEKEEEIIPELHLNEALTCLEATKRQVFTKPPARFTEASLVKEMETSGIGRPSTYASTVELLKRREYIVLKKKQYFVTDLGIQLDQYLRSQFQSVTSVEFTSQLENELDMISVKEKSYKDVVGSVYQPLKAILNQMGISDERTVKPAPEKTGGKCPLCGKDLLWRNSQNHRFIGCSGFPKCRFTSADPSDPVKTCPSCGKPMRKINGPKGLFWGCSGYPECRHNEKV